MEISEIADRINEIIKTLPKKQDKDSYIWDYNIKVRTKDGYDYEEETKEKVKVKKLDRPILQKK